MDLYEEKETIDKAKKDPDAFGLLYDKYYQPIFSYILRRTADIELTKDLTSETFFNALKGLGNFKWQNFPFSSWLYRIATNEVNSFYRNKKRVIQIPIERIYNLASQDNLNDDLERAEKELKNKEEFIKMHQSISQLNTTYQTIIVLRFFDKKKISEISQILDKPEGTIKSQIHRALEELRKFMRQ